MAGHSKWANIKHRKERMDAKRGKLFSRLIREVAVAAKIGGNDAAANPRLRLALERARDANVPGDNITRAIKRGGGQTDSGDYAECYEFWPRRCRRSFYLTKTATRRFCANCGKRRGFAFIPAGHFAPEICRRFHNEAFAPVLRARGCNVAVCRTAHDDRLTTKNFRDGIDRAQSFLRAHDGILRRAHFLRRAGIVVFSQLHHRRFNDKARPKHRKHRRAAFSFRRARITTAAPLVPRLFCPPGRRRLPIS